MGRGGGRERGERGGKGKKDWEKKENGRGNLEGKRDSVRKR